MVNTTAEVIKMKTVMLTMERRPRVCFVMILSSNSTSSSSPLSFRLMSGFMVTGTMMELQEETFANVFVLGFLLKQERKEQFATRTGRKRMRLHSLCKRATRSPATTLGMRPEKMCARHSILSAILAGWRASRAAITTEMALKANKVIGMNLQASSDRQSPLLSQRICCFSLEMLIDNIDCDIINND